MARWVWVLHGFTCWTSSIDNNVSSPRNPSSLDYSTTFSYLLPGPCLYLVKKSQKSAATSLTSCHHSQGSRTSSLTHSLERPSDTLPLSFHFGIIPVLRINVLLTKGVWYRGTIMRHGVKESRFKSFQSQVT